MLRRKSFTVGITTEDGYTEHVVEVSPADQLRAETEGRRYGLPAQLGDAPIGYTTLWIYLALVRQGLYAGKWQEFTTGGQLYDFEPVAEQDGGEAPVDPTPGRPDSGLPSPSTSETPATG